MVKRTRAVKKMETPEPDKFFATTNVCSNKRRKPQGTQQQNAQQQQRYENKSTTMNDAAAIKTIITTTTTPPATMVPTTAATTRIKKSTNELHYDNVAQDDDYDSLEDDEEAEESEIDLLDEDDDDVDVDVDETTLPISSDEEEFLETQRISLPELIVKKLLQTTATTCSTSQQQNTELPVETKKREKGEGCAVAAEKSRNHQVADALKQQSKESKEQKVIDIVKPILEPKLEKSDTDAKVSIPPEREETVSSVLGATKRRRGRPPKSKLTEANIQVEAKCDKALKRTASSSKPCCDDTKPVGVLGLISYNALDSTLHYQCQLCSVVFFNELQTYTDHLRSAHHVLKDHENMEMGVIPSRKCARSQQAIHLAKAVKPSLPTEVTEQKTNAVFNVEDNDSVEQPKDDKENILSQLNNRSIELEREPYFACGLVALYDAGRLDLVCKFCNSANLQEETFKKHLQMEHQGLITLDNVEEKSKGIGELGPRSVEKVTSKPSTENSYLISGVTGTMVRKVPSREHLMATQAPETPPPEEDEEQDNKYDSKMETTSEDGTCTEMDETVKETTSNKVKSSEALESIKSKASTVTDGFIEKLSSETVTPKDKEEEDKAINPRDKKSKVDNEPQQPKKPRKYRKRHSDIIDLDTKRATRQSRASSIKTSERSSTQEVTTPHNESQKPIQKLMNPEPLTTTSKTTKPTTTIPLEKRKRLLATPNTTARSKSSLSLKKEKKDITTTTTTTASTQVRESKQLDSTPLLLPPSSPSSQSVTIETTIKSAKKRGRGSVTTRKPTATGTQCTTTEAIDDIKTETTIKATERTTTTTTSTIHIATGAENVEDAIEMGENKDNKEVAPLNDTEGKVTSPSPSLKSVKPDIYCEICQKVFSKKSRLVEHRRLHTGELPFQCDKCDKRFRLKSRLTEHKIRHLGVKSFKCNVCGLALATKQDLSQHQRYHTDKRPHACPHCPKAFVRSSDFKIHLRIHTGEKPYVCDICNQSFRANQNLYVHRKMHLGVKDYICEFCEKAFMRKIDLRVHMRSHTGEKPFKCEICSRSFSSKFNVRTHIQRLHVANANGVERKKPGRKPNDLRAELERQKELIEELRNQLAQRVKTEQMILQQHCQQQQPLVIIPTATTATTAVASTSTATSATMLSSPTTFELMTTDSQTEQAEQKLNNQQPNGQSISVANIEIPPMSLMPTTIVAPATTIPSEISPQTEKTAKDATPLNTATPQPHDISILAVFTAQPHAAMQLNNLSTNSITATMTPLRLQLPTTGQTSAQKKERKITSYFNVLGQKS